VIWVAASVSVRDTLVHIIGCEWGWLTIWNEALPQFRLRDRFVDATRRPIPSECISRCRRGAVKMGGIEREQVEFVNRVANESLRRMLPVRETQISLAHLMQHLANHSTYHRGQSRANDAAACRCAGRYRLRFVFTGGTPQGSQCTLVYSMKI